MIEREDLRRFARNSGPIGTLRFIVITGLILYWVFLNRSGDLALETLVLVPIALIVPKYFRDSLVSNYTFFRDSMNYVLMAAAFLAAVYSRSPALNTPEAQLAMVTAFALHTGCCFWLLSDARILVEHED